MIESLNEQSLTTEVAISDVLRQIAVCQPYFALNRLQQTSDGTLWAPITPEQPMGVERGVMAAAETGRHLAILGSCAAARTNPDPKQHYYLAWKADLRQTDAAAQLSHAEAQLLSHNLIGSAKAHFISKRNARAETELIHQPTGRKLYDLSVDYKVLTPKLFERMYADRRTDTPTVAYNPYATQLLGLGDVMVLDDFLSANLQALNPTTCAGHFPNYPALPVAILAHILTSAAGRLFANVIGVENASYTVVNALVQAEHLAFSNDRLHVTIQHDNADDEGTNRVFRCHAVSEAEAITRPFGDLKITLRKAD